jgi:predicted kinase
MIVIMAGLPGTGKSTLARELASQTSGAVLDKDRIRAALFAPAEIEYSTEQDDFCMEVLLATAEYLLGKNPSRHVFLDGRPFARRYQIEQVIATAKQLRQPWRILECVCSDEAARKRIEEQAAEHPAANRDFSLYLKTKAEFEEITMPKTVVDTDRSLDSCVQQALKAISP